MPGTLRLVLRRTAAGVFVLWGAATLAFAALHLVPGDVVDTLLGPGTAATPELRERIRQDHGLDDPLIVQYLRQTGQLATGDLGHSYQLGLPVTRVLDGQLAPTAELALTATAFALLVAFAAAVLSAGRGRFVRSLVSGIELLAVSVPSYAGHPGPHLPVLPVRPAARGGRRRSPRPAAARADAGPAHRGCARPGRPPGTRRGVRQAVRADRAGARGR
ncbi:ABC transporter permease [Streptomyces sp. NPDC048301]|uniref:ABC transporter permease n=1 Tax=Streptomyces sp. NPDC048301 TaxID=3155631 RepID=UPI00341F4F4D